jgi:protein TonB
VSRRTDVVTVAIAIGLHIGLAVTFIHGPPPARARSRPIEVEFRRPKPLLASPAPPAAALTPKPAAAQPAAPVGGSTIAEPARSARSNPNAAGAEGSSGGAGSGAFASELEIKQMPEIDTEACGRSIAYPEEAERNGIEGKVRLRVTLDERGRVSGVRVLSGLGHGLDQAAVDALKHRCKFTPAIARDGRPVPFIVESYTFNFELPR